MTTTITLLHDKGTMTYDRDRLATAILVYLEVMGDDPAPTPKHTGAVRDVLRNDLGFATDSITYAVGARIAVQNNINP